jgi:hypothetical protein
MSWGKEKKKSKITTKVSLPHKILTDDNTVKHKNKLLQIKLKKCHKNFMHLPYYAATFYSTAYFYKNYALVDML